MDIYMHLSFVIKTIKDYFLWENEDEIISLSLSLSFFYSSNSCWALPN